MPDLRCDMNTTTDYSGRQVDVELLQTIIQPSGVVPVSISSINTAAKMVAGIQKLVQRYTLLLLTNLNDVKFDAEQGGDLLKLVLDGYVQDTGQLQYAFASANNRVVTQLNNDDLDGETYGTTPMDEMISEAILLDANVEKATSTAYLRIQIISQAGTEFTFVLPVTKK